VATGERIKKLTVTFLNGDTHSFEEGHLLAHHTKLFHRFDAIGAPLVSVPGPEGKPAAIPGPLVAVLRVWNGDAPRRISLVPLQSVRLLEFELPSDLALR
jgi:hypothetical protein